jgi:hypothetical protein
MHGATVKTVYLCVFFLWISKQTAIISLHSLKWLVFINETECVYCAVRRVALHIVHVKLSQVFLNLTEVFLCFFLSCKENARVKLAKTGHGPLSSTLVCICVVRLLFVLFYVLFVCKCVLPPGNNPIAVNKYIISYHYRMPAVDFPHNNLQLSDRLQCHVAVLHVLPSSYYGPYNIVQVRCEENELCVCVCVCIETRQFVIQSAVCPKTGP